jgi:hypothetical protein
VAKFYILKLSACTDVCTIYSQLKNFQDLCTDGMYTTMNTDRRLYPETPHLRHSIQLKYTALEAIVF